MTHAILSVRAALCAAGAAILAVSAAITPAHAQGSSRQVRQAEIGFIAIGPDITLRRMIVRNAKSKRVILFLHGFPETLYTWHDVALPLADQYEVHAFDWPGFGLSSRPTVDKFAYAPKDYARVLKKYIRTAGIDKSKLTIYATDIGALPALLLALEEPGIAKRIIVGDFAPFDRPQYMYESLQSLKSPKSSEQARLQFNKNRDEILKNAFSRGLPKEARFDVSSTFTADMLRGWNQSGMTSADAFYNYYSHFTRDQNYFETNIARLKTPVTVVWGAIDPYIKKEMGLELAKRINADISLLPGIGHYPHLQDPKHVIEAVGAPRR
jgi:pimeloyl-ACP methyl ester carboxylesterase